MRKLKSRVMMQESFDDIGFNAKLEHVMTRGCYLTATTWYHYIIRLYALDRYFIEIYYDVDEDEIARIAVAGGQELEKHLALIQLSELHGIGNLRIE
jgi:hypothetical protein